MFLILINKIDTYMSNLSTTLFLLIKISLPGKNDATAILPITLKCDL